MSDPISGKITKKEIALVLPAGCTDARPRAQPRNSFSEYLLFLSQLFPSKTYECMYKTSAFAALLMSSEPDNSFDLNVMMDCSVSVSS